MVDVNLNMKVPAGEKLLDYSASGTGAVAGTMLALWRARREAAARLITAKGEADALKLIAKAQAEALAIYRAAGPDAEVRGFLEMSPDGIRQRIEFQMFSEFSRYSINSIVHQESYEAIASRFHLSIPLMMEELGLTHGLLSALSTITVGTEGTALLKHCNNFLVIEGRPNQEINIHGFAMTWPGRELVQLHSTEPHMEYLRNFAKFPAGHDCKLKIAPAIELDSAGTSGCRQSELRIIEPTP